MPSPPAPAPPPDGAPVPYAGYPGAPAYPAALPPGAAPWHFRRYLTFLRREWWLVLLSVLVFAGLAAAYIAQWPASYASTAHLWAAGRTGLRLNEGATYDEDAQTFAGTQIELLQSDVILGRAFNRVHDTLHLSFPTNSEGKPVLPAIRVSQLPKSAVLELRAKGPSRKLVPVFLSAVMDEFLAYKKEVRSATSGGSYASVSEQTAKQEAELKAEQDSLNAYMRENNVAVLEERAKAASAYLIQLLAQSSELKLQLLLLEAAAAEGPWAIGTFTNALAGAPDPRQLANPALPFASPPPEFMSAQQELEKVRILRTRLSKYLRPEHPKIVKLDEQIAQDEKLVEYFSRQSREQLASARQTVKMRTDRVQETIKEWETKVNDASERIAEYERLKLSVDRLQALHASLLSLLQSVDVSHNLDQENITILDRPSEATNAKKSALVAAFLLFLGLGAGLGLVFLVEQSDDRVRSLEELTGRFDEWVVGQVPEVPKARKKKRPALLEANDGRHAFAESHRNLRSALAFATGFNGEEKPKLLLVTSAIPNEGKSTVAANLARTLAFAGARVLLVDGDMRRGVLHHLFGLPQEPGLSDLLSDGGDLLKSVRDIPLAPVNGAPRPLHSSAVASAKAEHSDPPSSAVASAKAEPSALRPLTSGQLHLLPRGRSVDTPGELLLGPNCSRLLERVRKEYDCVILDSIPVFAADDTTSLAPKLDGILFVVRSSFTSADTARSALELLYERQAKVLGLVFNRANGKAKSYKYYKYASYYQNSKT
ncbi:MAG: polysaccharide biosynthesis tyrosine autokinase [Limisphaerales bacterium]